MEPATYSSGRYFVGLGRKVTIPYNSKSYYFLFIHKLIKIMNNIWKIILSNIRYKYNKYLKNKCLIIL